MYLLTPKKKLEILDRLGSDLVTDGTSDLELAGMSKGSQDDSYSVAHLVYSLHPF